jgi:acetolactate synthase-1/2/3 large subunit
MLGMHGTYEANLAMHGCDVMFNIGARFDDRVTGRLNAFAPNSLKIHADIDPSSINKNVKVEVPVVGDAAAILRAMIAAWEAEPVQQDRGAIASWWRQIDEWRGKKCLGYVQEGKILKPQHAVKRLYELTKESGRETFISTEVGQHQMWAAQYFGFEKPNRWMTSGGLGTMGYGLPAAMGVQVAHPDALCIDIAGEASILMNIQEMATLAQYRLPVKVFILNNQYMGMVRQWQELLHGGRYSESYSAALPDFVKLAESFHGTGMRVEAADDLDRVIREMIAIDGPVIVDCAVDERENVFPMIPSGAAHNEMLLAAGQEGGITGVTDEGKVLV